MIFSIIIKNVEIRKSKGRNKMKNCTKKKNKMMRRRRTKNKLKRRKMKMAKSMMIRLSV
jgi:hypothetical protein